MNRAQFEKQLSDHGYGAPRPVEFEPGREVDRHTHDFSAMILVTGGEFTLGLDSGPSTLGAGDWCEVLAGTEHSEHGGSAGASLLVGRK